MPLPLQENVPCEDREGITALIIGFILHVLSVKSNALPDGEEHGPTHKTNVVPTSFLDAPSLVVLMSLCCWLASLPAQIKVKGRRQSTSGPHHCSRSITDGPGEATQMNNMILAACRVRPDFRYDHLCTLENIEREQYRWWKARCPEHLSVDGHLIHFQIDDIKVLPHGVPIQQCSLRASHGLIIEMEEGQPQSLLAEFPFLQDFFSTIPTAAVRLPVPHLLPILDQRSATFLLPDWRRGNAPGSLKRSAGRFTWECEWDRLAPNLTRNLPRSRNLPLQPAFAESDAQRLEQAIPAVLDALREQCARLDANDPADLRVLHASHVNVARVQNFVDDLDPAIARSVSADVFGCLHEGADVVQGHKNICYRAAFVVQVLLQCDLLTRDASLKEAVASALKLAVPRSLLPTLMDLTDQHTMFPSKSQVSRWRLLLDGASMMQTRQEELNSGVPGTHLCDT